MENKPKKSKALIITIIILLLLILASYFVYQNRDSFGVKTSAAITKLFSPLLPSENSSGIKTIVQAGEDIKKGDSVSVFGTGTNNNPIVVKATSNSNIYGTASEDILSGNLGEIMAKGKTVANKFFDSFSGFIGSLFNKGTETSTTNTTENVTYQCTKDGEEVDCSTVSIYQCTKDGEKIDCNTIGVYQCTKNGQTVDCSTVVTGSGTGVYECKKDGVVVDCSTIVTGSGTGVYECKKDGVVVDCSTIGNYQCKKDGVVVDCSTIGNYQCKKNDVVVDCSTIGNYECKKDGVVVDCSTVITNPPTTTCDSPKVTDSTTNMCIDPSECKYPKSINGNKCEVSQYLPTVTLTPNPSNVVDGGISTINWTSENTAQCDTGSGYTYDTSGSFSTGRLSKTTSYSITCKGSRIDGEASGNTIVYVGTEPRVELLPTVKVTANPTSITSIADGSTITWESTNTTKCNANDPDRGTAVIGNFFTGRLLTSKLYTVRCTGLYGSSGASVWVNVDENPINGENPDLTADTVKPTTIYVNELTNLSSIITNNGEGSTVNDFATLFTINTTDSVPTTITTISAIVPALDSKISGVATAPYTFTTTGTYSIRACADSSTDDVEAITESNEDNNCGEWTTVTVTTSTVLPTVVGVCTNEATNYPTCDDNLICANYAVNYPQCTINENGECLNGNTNPPDCTTPDNSEENKCLLISDNPLTFTDVEKAKLAELLRKFYIIATTLKTEEDIAVIYKEMDNYKSLITNIEDLTKQCYNQTISKDKATLGNVYNTDGTLIGKYTGPTTRQGNPWYNYTEGRLSSYVPASEDTSKTSNYCAGNTTSKYRRAGGVSSSMEKCSSTEKQAGKFECEQYRYNNANSLMMTGCSWIGGTDLMEYEKILNIW